MSIHVCKCEDEYHLRYPGLSANDAQVIADKINAGALMQRTDSHTHCSHGIPYTDMDCMECDRVWADQVTMPSVRKELATLLRFYSKESLIDLIFEQSRHVEKLQDKLPKSVEPMRISKVREG